MSIFDHRKPAETGKSGKIEFPDTRLRTIVVDGGEYAPQSGTAGVRTTPEGTIDRFDPAVGITSVREASEFSVHQFLEPQNPTGVGATATGSTTIDITATGDPGGNDGVEIHMSTTQGSGYALETTVEDTDFNAPIEISGLTAETTYYFVLRAFLWDGVKKDASFTAEVSATTGAGGAAPASSPSPTIAEVSRTATTMTLEATWTDVGDETSYEWWAGSNNAVWSNGSQSAANSELENTVSVQYTATRTNADDSTFFCLRACNASGCASHKCNGFTVAGNLTAPTSLAATNPSGSDVDVDWVDMAGASVADLTAIERRLVGGSFTEIATVAFGTTHYDDNGLADGSYEYRVRARDNDTGNNSPYSNIDSVGIGTGGGGSDHPNEPAGYAQITDRGFSAYNEDGWSNNGTANYTVPVTDGAAPMSPSDVGQIQFNAGFTGGGGAATVFRNFTGRSSLYIHFAVKHSSNWQGHDSGVNKILFITNNAGDSYGGGGDPAFFSAQGANTATLNFQVRLQGPGNEASQSAGSNLGANLSSASMARGTWHEFEVILTANTGTNFNGEVHVWKDGTKTHQYTDVKFFDDSAESSDHNFDQVKWNPTWGGVGDTVEATMQIFIDHIYVSGA